MPRKLTDMSALTLWGLTLNTLGALLLAIVETNHLNGFIQRYYENKSYPALFDLFSGEEITPSDDGFVPIFNSVRGHRPDPSEIDSEYAENISPQDYVFNNSEEIIGRLSENIYRPFEYYQFDRKSYPENPEPNSIWIKGEQHHSDEGDFTYGFSPDSTVVLEYSERFEVDRGEWNGTSLEYCEAAEIPDSFIAEVDSISERSEDQVALAGVSLLLLGFLVQAIPFLC